MKTHFSLYGTTALAFAGAVSRIIKKSIHRNNQTTAEESFLLRYAGLPFTSLYGEARLKQEGYSRSADERGDVIPAPHDFDLASDATVRWQGLPGCFCELANC